jgi:hypothetical protein
MSTPPVAPVGNTLRSQQRAGAAAAPHTATTVNRILAVTRLHFVNPWTIVVVPGLILLMILVVNITIWWLILSNVETAADRADVSAGFGYSGASFFIFVYMMVVAVQGMNLTFPFALGYGVTRREFYLGSSVAFVLLSAFWAVILTALATIEEATNGWGVSGRMFSAIYFGEGEWYQRLFLFFVTFLFFFFAGQGVATLYVRWKTNGLLIFFALLAVLLVGSLAAIIRTDSWGPVIDWFVHTGPYGVSALSLIPAGIAALGGYAVLLRATPKS